MKLRATAWRRFREARAAAKARWRAAHPLVDYAPPAAWCKDALAWSRWLLFHYVVIVGACGIRPKTLADMKWKNVGKDSAGYHLHGKTAKGGRKRKGVIIPEDSASASFKMLRRFCPSEPDDPILPVAKVKKSFENLLIAADLLHDQHGQRRTPYSLRHAYITRMLAAGRSVNLIARNTQTSAAMISKFYDHLQTMLHRRELMEVE